jgi:hypothetical protein
MMQPAMSLRAIVAIFHISHALADCLPLSPTQEDAMNDLISYVIEKAIEAFGGKKDGTFNAACFAIALRDVSGVKQILDGKLVSAILVGRPDIERLTGGCHFHLLANSGGAK